MASLLVVYTVVGLVMRAVAPSLLVSAPHVLALLDNRLTVQVLLSDRLGIVTLTVFAAVGMAISDPIAFHLGRQHGFTVVDRGRRWLPGSMLLVTAFQSILTRTRGFPLVFFGGVTACLVAGASGISRRAFYIADAIGIGYRLSAVVTIATTYPTNLNDMNTLIDEYTALAVALTTGIVLVDLIVGYLRTRHRIPSVQTVPVAAGPETMMTEPSNPAVRGQDDS